MDTTKFGIIGVGGRGVVFQENNHLPEEGYEIIAGADVNPEALDGFKKRFPAAFTTSDYKELLALPQVEAVFIITPDFLHEEMACAALEAGKHVYLEKPLAITVQGCENILRCAMKNKRKLYVGHNMRFFPAIRKMKEIIDSGRIGEVQLGWCRHFINYGGDAYFHDWHSEQKYTTGLLLQKGAHDIDVLHWLMNSYSVKTVAMGMLSVYDKCRRREPGTPGKALWDAKNYPPEEVETPFSAVIDVEDSNMVLMQLASGKQCAYLQCHYTPDCDRNYTFIGTRGRIENCGIGDNAQIKIWTCRAPGNTIPDEMICLRGIPGTHSGADPAIMRDFREYIRFDKKPGTTPLDAYRAVLTGIKAHESARNGLMGQEIPEVAPDIIDYFDNR